MLVGAAWFYILYFLSRKNGVKPNEAALEAMEKRFPEL